MEPSKPAGSWLWGALILVVALYGIFFQLRLPTQLPEQGDYEKLAQVLEAEAQPGDVLLLYPWWAERARLFAPERLPVVGYQGSDGDALERHPRIWVLSQPDLPKSSWSTFMSAFSDRRTAIGGERTFGKLHLALFQNGRARSVKFSLTDQLAQAQVYLEQPDGTRTPCQWDGRSAHRCPGNTYVATEWHEVRFQPRHCLRLFPPGGPTRLVVELPGVAAADALQLYGGFIWDRGYFNAPKYTETHVGVDVNGAAATSLDFPAGRYGEQSATGPAVSEGSSVRVWSQTQNPEQREVCVEVYGYGAAT